MFQPGVDFPEGTRICDVQLRNGSDLLEGVVGYDPAAEVGGQRVFTGVCRCL